MASEIKTKFQKKNKAQIVSIPGTRPSIHNSQLLTSTGVPSFDSIIGGGIPVGSIVLIEEDRYNIYSNILLKIYLAEGISCEQFIHLVSLDENPYSILNELPTRCSPDEPKKNNDKEEMKIAWRYKHQSSFSNPNGHAFYYDLNKFIEFNDIKKFASGWNNDKTNNDFDSSLPKLQNPLFNSLLENIKNQVLNYNVLASDKTSSNLLRIGIHSMLSPLWGNEAGDNWKDLTTFLIYLKSIVRSSFSTVMITIPSHIISDMTFITRIYSIVDYAVKLESFVEKEVSPIFKEYHGLLYIKKVASINSLVPLKIESLDWAFQLKKRNFLIKRLHLPPDLSETVSRTVNISKHGTTACMGEKLPTNLDF